MVSKQGTYFKRVKNSNETTSHAVETNFIKIANFKTIKVLNYFTKKGDDTSKVKQDLTQTGEKKNRFKSC